MAKLAFPTTADEFKQHLEQQGQRDDWTVDVVPAEGDDIRNKTRVVFTLRDMTMADGYVAHEYDDLIVTLDGDYWFGLDRLHEDYPRWTWQKQVGEKSWCTVDHLRLLDALVELFPPSLYA
ncbi:hypothetical protein [Paraburkholderia phytofirmans]|uniref:Uncharacterized protein n=1 Tax=Paraburkholderia phytofirmans OLGA172 TaxID=1417228 RepID=A0A161I1U5_9BURK|nr:hypothetical protein [Paraburkholderia phytofirmans]ANB71933.1 hypothetical protein AYM40_05755 [Paraburkholderia phytofirmans OLGA172]